MRAERIDSRFVPVADPELAVAELEGELVMAVQLDLASFNNFDAHWFDANAAAVWRGFDGQRSVAEVADLIATAFEMEPAAALDSVLEITKIFARAGAFEGIAAERPEPPARSVPEGLPIGSVLPAFRLEGLEGAEHTSEEVFGPRTLLVHWSPGCGFCVTFAQDLVKRVPALDRAGVEVVFLTQDDGDTSAQLLADIGLEIIVLRNDGYSPFLGMGTPSGYLVGAGGRIEEGLAVGAIELGAVAQRLADGADRGR